MIHLRYMILQILMIYYCISDVYSNKNVMKSEFMSEKISEAATYTITVNITSSLNETDVKFLSIATDNKRVLTVTWNSSEKFQNLASALSPCEFRLGGTTADFLIFDPIKSAKERPPKVISSSPIENFTLTGEHWDMFTEFVAKVGWDLKFNFNLFFWRSDGLWKSTNAELLLNYSSARGVRIPYFQLGNEPNAYWGNFGFRISANILVQNFKILRDLISRYPLYKSSKLYGPDITNVGTRNTAPYFREFIAAGADDVVDEYSLHHYYLDGKKANAQDFLNVTVLESLREVLELALQISNEGARPLRIRLTETASCYGGGAPGLSDSYIAGFLWLDKLGMAAQYGVTRVFRQSIIGASYALISNTFDPKPDYFLSLIFKRLVEGPVFKVSLDVLTQNLRVYAHCARRDTYSPGALVIYYLNLAETQAVLSFSQFKSANLDLYLLTPGDDDGLQSKYVKLNGNILLMNGPTLPSMSPKPYKGLVSVEAQSFGFIVVPQANVKLCVDYFANLDSKCSYSGHSHHFLAYFPRCGLFSSSFWIFAYLIL